jgi:predicted acetyltransferase
VDVELRPITEDEYPAFARAIGGVFGHVVTDDEIPQWRSIVKLDRTIAGFEGGEIACTASSFELDLTLPGGDAVPAAGITSVTVQPTHRRRGLLRRMMAHQLDDVAARGEHLAVLTASESLIYGRFGYGVASFKREWALPVPGADFVRPPTAGGRIRTLVADEARKVLPGIYEQAARRIPGAVSRDAAWWDKWFLDRPDLRRGASAGFFAVHEDDSGAIDGYAIWRRRDRVLIVHELHATDDEVEAALFRFLLDIDLVREVVGRRRPVDERLVWRLADPRRLQVTEEVDDLYVRLVDPGGALSARAYGTDGELVLALTDPFRPANDGRWRVSGAGCERTTRDADLALGAPELGSIYLGGVKPSVLARAGRVEERRPGALLRADALFGWPAAPWLTNGF